MKKSMREFLRSLEQRGWTLSSQKNHYKLRRGPHVLVVSQTPSDRRALDNADAVARRLERM